MEDTLRPDRLVFGVQSEWAEQQIRAAFAPVIEAGTPVVVTDFATAELVKVAANSFLATKISFINAMAEILELRGDVLKLAEAIGYDARIGRRFLQAGLGFGGGCLPRGLVRHHRPGRRAGRGRGVRSCTRWIRSTSGGASAWSSTRLEILDGSYMGMRVMVALEAAFK